MKKSFTILCSVFFLCFSYSRLHAQDKIIGEKSKAPNQAIIGEKKAGVIGEEGLRIRNMKLKNEISALYADFLRKQADAEAAAAGLKRKLEEAMKDLEANDKMGNFEIQDLMSRYSQAQALASQVLKKMEDTKNSVIGKL